MGLGRRERFNAKARRAPGGASHKGKKAMRSREEVPDANVEIIDSATQEARKEQERRRREVRLVATRPC